MNIAILFLMILPGIVQSQTVSMGTGLGPDILIFEKETSVGMNLNISVSVPLSGIFEMEFRPGIAFNSEDFNGYELSTNLKIFPFQSGVNLIVGIKLHANVGGSGTSHYIRNDLFVLPLVGVGYKIKVQKTFVTFDLTFQKPFPNGVYYFNSYVENKDYYSTNFDTVISFNIGFAWEL
ncbi:MAG: hypothetical protein IH618_12010 [Ignavibacteriaceae bacterium]|nr:hypothetical protein [Ignavibacteriaceae bacterium]